MSTLKLMIVSPNGIIWSAPAGLMALKEVRTKPSQYAIGYKKSLDGELVFKGADYKYFLGLAASNRRYNNIRAVIYSDCNGVEEIKYKGYINLRSARFDYDNCNLYARISLDDPYELYDSIKDEEYNLYDLTSERNDDIYSPRGVGQRFQNGLPLLNVINGFIRELFKYGSIRSDFFQWASSNPSYTIGNSAKVQRLYLFQLSDIIRANISGYTKATIMTYSLGAIIDNLCKMFNLRYDIDLNGNIRIEHVSWWQQTVGLDLTIAPYSSQILGSNDASLNDVQVYKKEVYSNLLSKNKDFVGLPIVYDNSFLREVFYTAPSGLSDVIDEKRVPKIDVKSEFATDIEYLETLNDDDSTNFDGIALVAVTQSNVIERDTSILDFILSTPVNKANNVLSWALLHHNFHRHERLFDKGSMNGAQTTFITTQRILKQETIRIKVCCDTPIDEKKLVRTGLGEGVIQKLVIVPGHNYAEIDLLFQYSGALILTAPFTTADLYATNRNTLLDTAAQSLTTLISNDTGATSVYAEIKKTDQGGTVQIFSTGHFRYTPPANWSGVDGFDYYPLNSAGKSDVGKANIIVKVLAIYVKGTQVNSITPLVPSGSLYLYQYRFQYFADSAGLVPLNLDYYNLTIHFQKNINGTITNHSFVASGYDDWASAGIFGSPQTVSFTILTDPAYNII